MSKSLLSFLGFISILFFSPAKAQDTIYSLNKGMFLAKILEVNNSTVKFKKYNFQEGPNYEMLKSEIGKIVYENGRVEIFETKANNENTTPTNISTDTARIYTLTLTDGSILKGVILSQNENELLFKDNNIGERKISRTKIKSLQLASGGLKYVFKLNDGTLLVGEIINKNDRTTVILTDELGTISLLNFKIKEVAAFKDATVKGDGKIWYQNPNCTRYLFAPSAIPLKKGEGYYQNIYGPGNAVNIGLTKNISFGVGLLGPVGIYLNTKIGVKLHKYLHVAGGALVGNSFFPIDGDNFGLGVGFGALTVGSYEHNITAGIGYGFVNKFGSTSFQEKPLYVINGMTRLSKSFALVSENWVFNVVDDPFDRGVNYDHYEVVFSYAFRYMNEKRTLDAGFINTPALVESGYLIGIPYVGMVIRFGNYKDKN